MHLHKQLFNWFFSFSLDFSKCLTVNRLVDTKKSRLLLLTLVWSWQRLNSHNIEISTSQSISTHVISRQAVVDVDFNTKYLSPSLLSNNKNKQRNKNNK